MRRLIAPRGHVAHLSRSRSKYGVRTDAAGKLARTVDGHLFASKAEAKRYGELKLLQKAGAIFHVRVQPRFRLCAWTSKVQEEIQPLPALGEYRADFAYHLRADCVCAWGCVVEDVKGVDTPLSRWKRRHVEAQYGVKVQVIR